MVGADVVLLVNQHPGIALADAVEVTVEVGAINLPRLPVAVGVVARVVACNKAVVGRHDGLAGTEGNPIAAFIATSVGAPLGVVLAVHQIVEVLVSEACHTVEGLIDDINGTLGEVGGVLFHHHVHKHCFGADTLHVQQPVGNNVGIGAVGIGVAWACLGVKVVAHHGTSLARDAGVVLVVVAQLVDDINVVVVSIHGVLHRLLKCFALFRQGIHGKDVGCGKYGLQFGLVFLSKALLHRFAEVQR